MLKSLSILLILMLSNSALASSQRSKEEYVASIIYAEALGQSDYAKGLVATTIWVRSNGDSKKFRKVCSIPKQYARPQRNDDKDWQDCLSLAKRMYKGTFTPLSIKNSKGKWVQPDHFYLYGSTTPFWARGMWQKRVDDLMFLKLGRFRTKG